jgi:ABC-type spermidine/putrescine transport system permease subunit I
MYTEFAAFVGLVYLILPFSFFIMLSVFDGIDKKTLEASADLGGGPIRTFYEVLLPLTKNGIFVASAQSFIWAMGTYATPSALGPNTLWTVGYLIQEQMLGRQNWPLASALGMALAVGVMVVMLLSRSFAPRAINYHV